ncbi:hypothetical protein V6M85_03115 [Sulfolobus tengchongensis]|uniref:ABC transporter permease n=1 Tax=Sulfolobus tengchongensis TaxID=207809 RepID=A0AAX4L1I9_9CREN
MPPHLQIFKILFKERYKDPTLQLMLPVMLAGYVFVPAFLEKGQFLDYAIVIAYIPIISLPETIALSLALRNIIFVLGDHLTSGSIVSFLMMPIKRSMFFLMSYVLDVVLPYLFWLVSNYFYLADIEYINALTNLLSLTYTAGYFFSTSVILFYTLLLRSNGASTLASLFTLGSIFIIGGFGNYALVSTDPHLLAVTSFMNPYPLLLYYSFTQRQNIIPFLFTGIMIDFVSAIVLAIISFLMFIRLEV